MKLDQKMSDVCEMMVLKKLIIFASEVRIYEQRDTMSLVSITLETLGG